MSERDSKMPVRALGGFLYAGGRLLLAVVALVAVGAAPAGADQCTSAKLKAIGKKESGLLACQAKVAASGDSSGLSACESRVMAKFSARLRECRHLHGRPDGV